MQILRTAFYLYSHFFFLKQRIDGIFTTTCQNGIISNMRMFIFLSIANRYLHIATR